MLKRLFILSIAAVAAFGADISGTWNMAVETEMGSGTPTIVLKQDGEKLSGTYNGQLGEAPLTGTVKGDTVSFWFEVSPGGDKIKVTYSGKLEGAVKMKGEIDFAGMGKGTFTGAKK